MSDITLCVNNKCEQRSGCLRYRSEWTTRWQSASYFTGIDCKYFIKVDEALDKVITQEQADQRMEEDE